MSAVFRNQPKDFFLRSRAVAKSDGLTARGGVHYTKLASALARLAPKMAAQEVAARLSKRVNPVGNRIDYIVRGGDKIVEKFVQGRFRFEPQGHAYRITATASMALIVGAVVPALLPPSRGHEPGRWWPQRDLPEFAPRFFRVVWGAANPIWAVSWPSRQARCSAASRCAPHPDLPQRN